jgi:ribonuclease HII
MDGKFVTSWNRRPGHLEYSDEISRLGGFTGPLICGVDEAGRGPLAGPVVASAVILCDGFDATGLDDSKKLRPKARERQRERILDSLCLWGIGIVEPDVIDEINILQSTFQAMRQAIAAMGIEPEIVLVDGCHRIPRLSCNQQAIVDGDALEPSIAAASILAKTYRDDLMVRHGETYPEYLFEKHKGYPTLEHLTRIFQHGPCPIHRKSFHPISTFYPRNVKFMRS